LDDHIEHLRFVFAALREACLFANLEKCTFCTNQVAFLGYVVTPHMIEVDEANIEAMKSWPIPATLTQLQSFLGLMGFYRYFMRDFSTIAAPLNDMMKKGVLFHWGASFHKFIDKLTRVELLQLLDFGTIFELECDPSEIGIGGLLVQEGKPVA
jgi:hypothetical protein